MSLTTPQHYSEHARLDDAFKRLITAYPDGPSVYQLAPLDQLHIGGIKASERLAEFIATLAPASVLDIGSGLGGLLRVCHSRHPQCQYYALDITHSLSAMNHKLNHLCRYNTIQSLTADAHHLPFANASMDLVIMQHSLLNIPDKAQALSECVRVLRKGGRLVLHEVAQGEQPDKMHFPVPWAQEASQSFLETTTALTNRISNAGFDSITLEDWSAEALQWRQRQSEKASSAPAVVSPADVLGHHFSTMGANVAENLANDAIRIVQLVATRR